MFCRQLAVPGSHLLTGAAENPRPDRNDQAGLYGDFQERVRSKKAPCRVVPPDERLHAHSLPCPQVDYRLVMHDQLVSFESERELLLCVNVVSCRSAVGLVEDLGS